MKRGLKTRLASAKLNNLKIHTTGRASPPGLLLGALMQKHV